MTEGPGKRSTYHLTDEKQLEALAHPVRARLLRILRTDGAATASGLAAKVGESSGVTSYHLRKLADVGLVAEDVERGTRRERWWVSAHTATDWSPADFLGNPDAHRSTVSLRRELHRWQSRLLDQWLDDEPEWDAEWVRAAGFSDDLLVLTPMQARAMVRELWAVVQRYRAEPPTSEDETPEAARVVWFSHVVPVRGELPL